MGRSTSRPYPKYFPNWWAFSSEDAEKFIEEHELEVEYHKKQDELLYNFLRDHGYNFKVKDGTETESDRRAGGE